MPPGKAIQSCPLAKGTIWVSVTYADTAACVAGTSVILTGPTPGQETIGTTPLVKFAERAPGDYKFQVSLPAGKRGDHSIIPYSQALSVGMGGVAVGAVEVVRVGTLEVRVVDDRSPPQAVNGVRISASGPEELDQGGTAGSHRFSGIRAGTYRVSATADRGDLYSPSTVSAAVQVPSGGTAQTQLVLQLVNIVSPVIELVGAGGARKENELWFVQSAHAGTATGAGFVEQPIEIVFRYMESNAAKPYRGGGTISWEPGLKLYSEAQCTNEVAAQSHMLHVTNQQLLGPYRLWARGSATGTLNVDLALDQAAG
jgi:hypothetical protein